MARGKAGRGERDGGDISIGGERGPRKELGVRVDEAATRLLSFGLELGNFTAAFLMLLRCEETFDDVVHKCWPNAPERGEATALDCIPCVPEQITNALENPSWNPTTKAKRASWL